MQTEGDVTVNFTLQPGRVSQSVTVTANPVELQMNTTTKELTVTGTQLSQLPFQDRSPFSAALLDPAVVDVYPYGAKPYAMWQATEMDFGGGTSRENDVFIDGSSATIGPKGTYTPTIEGTQEVVVEQVAVDAEYGHSAGGVINMSTPQGTNKFHGSAFYFGINPSLNAVSNAVDIPRSPSLSRDNQYGGAIGGPIKKNKLFNFFDYEGRYSSSPSNVTYDTAHRRRTDRQLLAIVEFGRQSSCHLQPLYHAIQRHDRCGYAHAIFGQRHPDGHAGSKRSPDDVVYLET